MSPSEEWAKRGYERGHVLFGEDTTNRVNEGIFLDALHRLGLARDDVSVTNLVKRAQEGATLDWGRHRREIEACAEAILLPEIAKLAPELLIAVGGPAQKLLGVGARGTSFVRRPGWPTLPVSGIWHPGYFKRIGGTTLQNLENYTEQMRQALGSLLGRLGARRPSPTAPPPSSRASPPPIPPAGA